ncbi:carboxyl-terminal processing protease [Singulisphaera sp. GP187]|uniref:carboxy terminal-processing peptidase n=1 Tax=Singulisphaera sp. GP187 TaxID=1882752 RepID=UPI000929AE39|nr:carboxy terminal-processing peptidase [Singulisphaera sp. GP187]SIN92711.1 carboxyl-terminal processing protease [Singulisphaera sp. GP187]
MPRLAFRPLALIAIMGFIAAVVGAQTPTSKPLDEDTARVVVNLLELGHMAKPKIDDEIAKKWCHNFLKDLDPQKYYFLKADIDEFMAEATTLDDKIKEGNLDFPKKVFARFLERTDERLKTALEYLDQKPDFTVDEAIDDDPDLIDYPATEGEAKERWRKRIKLDLLQLKVDKTEDKEAVDKVKIRYKDRNRLFHQFDMSELLEVYLSSLTRTFDPHSSYMSAKTLEDTIGQTLHLSLEGIGASLQSENGYAVVKEVVPGMAADKDGRLQPEDKIIGIQNEDGSETDLVEKKLSDVVRFIRGPRGTKVRLIVQPTGTKDRKIYELTRQKIELVEQHAKGQIIDVKDPENKVYKVGVINLPAFYGDTQAVMAQDPDAVSATVDTKKLINSFKQKGINALILDLRGNGGGLLEEARTLSGLFIDRGPIVQVKDASGVKHIDDKDEGAAWTGPLVVLIDHLSASASEIFAGVIKDYDRGLIIGDSSTFGKGTVQSIVPINEQLRRRDDANLGALKLTIQQFYRVNGESTQVLGVTPHIHIPSIRDKADFGEGKMDNALKFDKVNALPIAGLKQVNPSLVRELETRSLDRRKANVKFQKQEERIAKFVERKARHSISLNEEKFRSEFVPDEDITKDEDKPKKDKAKKKFTEHPAWESDYYNDEVASIVADYLTLGSKVLTTTTTGPVTNSR